MLHPKPCISVLVLRLWYAILTLPLLNPRCQKPPFRAVTTVGAPRQRCLRTPWRCTSSRSPWLMASPPRRSNSSSSTSCRASLAKPCTTTRRWRGTAALGFALAAPQTTETVVPVVVFQTHQSPCYRTFAIFVRFQFILRSADVRIIAF